MHDLSQTYRAKTDEELLRLAMHPEQLTAHAQSALAGELTSRRITNSEHAEIRREQDQEKIGQPRTPGVQFLAAKYRVDDFIFDVLTIYRKHFWLFVKLTGPAVVLGYIAIMTGRGEGREIARYFGRGVGTLSYKTAIIEIWFVHFAAYLVSWTAFCFSFGAICSATARVEATIQPSITSSLAAIHSRMGPFIRLSMLLLVLFWAAMAAAGIVFVAVLWILDRRQLHFSTFTLQTISLGLWGSAILLISRFGLSIPALLLDNYTVIQSMFRSDELTEGKWTTLAVLLAKSTIGSYIAGMCPFWLASLIPANVQLPTGFQWVLSAASIAGVTVVEPTMFIGFCLLYLRGSALASATREFPIRQLEVRA